jgi:hypothetical protein
MGKLDAEFEEITEGEELTKKEQLNTKWAALEVLMGDPKRIALVAADLVAHLVWAVTSPGEASPSSAFQAPQRVLSVPVGGVPAFFQENATICPFPVPPIVVYERRRLRLPDPESKELNPCRP